MRESVFLTLSTLVLPLLTIRITVKIRMGIISKISNSKKENGKR